MRTIILSSLLLLAASMASAANTGSATEARNANAVNSIRNLPVIVKNETLAPNLCRLHFDTGTTMDVRCHTGTANK